MIVYIESNFLLEIALGQEQAVAAGEILNLAASRKVHLVIPTFGLSEPFSRIRQGSRDRERLSKSMRESEPEWRRAEHSKEIAEASRKLRDAMAELRALELDRLESAIKCVLRLGETVELDQETFASALQFREELGFREFEDSIVFACIISDLRERPPQSLKCFASRDVNAFFDSGVKQHLDAYNCRYISSFRQALNFISRRLEQS